MMLSDISSTGCSFITSASIEKGEYLEIELRKLDKDFVFNEPLILSCETVYCLPLGGSANRVGAKFLELDGDAASKIQQFTETGWRNTVYIR